MHLLHFHTDRQWRKELGFIYFCTNLNVSWHTVDLQLPVRRINEWIHEKLLSEARWLKYTSVCLAILHLCARTLKIIHRSHAAQIGTLLPILGWPPKFSLKSHSEGWMSGEGEGKHLWEDWFSSSLGHEDKQMNPGRLERKVALIRPWTHLPS